MTAEEDGLARLRAALRGVKALSFDVYGTLIDWESGMLAALAPLLARVEGPVDREAVLALHAAEEARAQRQAPHRPYRDILATVHRRIAARFGLQLPWEESQAYGLSVADWPAFEDSAAALARLGRHFVLVALTNVDNVNFAASNEKLGRPFAHVFTAEDNGCYKPDPRSFRAMFTGLAAEGIARSALLHVAESHFHDLAPAARLGLPAVWIHRRAGREGFGATRTPPRLAPHLARFGSLAAFADAVDAALGASQGA